MWDFEQTPDHTMVDLPHPPSVNRTRKHFPSKQEKDFKRAALARCKALTRRFDGPVKVEMIWHPPDRRKRDFDNILKASLDVLTRAGVYADDSLIERFTMNKGHIIKGGKVRFTVSPL